MDIGYDPFCIYFKAVVSKTASYLTTGSDETC